MPVDRLYQGTEPVAHPITGEMIPLDDRDAMFKAWVAGENRLRTLSHESRDIRRACDALVYAMAGRDVVRTATREWARDEIDQGC